MSIEARLVITSYIIIFVLIILLLVWSFYSEKKFIMLLASNLILIRNILPVLDFESKKLFETTRAHVTVGYALTNQDAVAVRWSRSWGDEAKDAVRLQYTRSF